MVENGWNKKEFGNKYWYYIKIWYNSNVNDIHSIFQLWLNKERLWGKKRAISSFFIYNRNIISIKINN